MTQIYSRQDPDALIEAVKTLRNGGFIIYPTDTLYGLGCDATNTESVGKLFDIKKRDRNKPISIILPSLELVNQYAHTTELAKEIFQNSTEPTTVVLESKGNLPKILTAHDNSIAVRIPQQSFSLDLAKNFKLPITATSANISGEKFISFEKMIEDFPEIDLVIRDMDIEKNTNPSTIVDARSEKLIFLRK